MAPIGRATEVTVEVVSEMKPFHEIGQRYATELRPGNVNVRGSIGRRANRVNSRRRASLNRHLCRAAIALCM